MKSTGYFILTSGVLIFIFVWLKSLTFDAIIDVDFKNISLKNPFELSFLVAIILSLLGLSMVLFSKKS